MIHFFMPLTIQCLPSSESLAVVVMPCTSEPACGSEIANEMNFLPLRTCKERVSELTARGAGERAR